MIERPLYTAFYTRNTFYEQEAERLRDSLDKFGLPHDIRPVDSQGDWIANTKLTATHIVTMLKAYPDRPVVQLDADAFIHRRPDLFEDGLDCDVAVHYRQGHELLNGTVYFAPTAGAKMVAEKYLEIIQANPGCANEQTCLDAATKELSDLIKLYKLPAGYTFIADIMRNDRAEGEEIVIEHLQASRQARGTGLLESRNRRIAELETSGAIGKPRAA